MYNFQILVFAWKHESSLAKSSALGVSLACFGIAFEHVLVWYDYDYPLAA